MHKRNLVGIILNFAKIGYDVFCYVICLHGLSNSKISQFKIFSYCGTMGGEAIDTLNDLCWIGNPRHFPIFIDLKILSLKIVR